MLSPGAEALSATPGAAPPRKFPATIVLLSVRVLLLRWAKPPPEPTALLSASALLLVIVTFVNLAVESPPFATPPPSRSARLPEIVLLMTRRVRPSLSRAPPRPPPEYFPVNVLFKIVRAPRLKIAPPPLPLKILI